MYIELYPMGMISLYILKIHRPKKKIFLLHVPCIMVCLHEARSPLVQMNNDHARQNKISYKNKILKSNQLRSP